MSEPIFDGAPPEAGQAPAAPDQGAGATATPDSFTNIDPNSLPPELSGLYKNMQADYTRKMQEIAPYRSLGDVNQVQEALQFAQQLESNQEFQRQLYEALGQHLGVTPAQAQAMQEAGVVPEADEYDLDDPLAKEVEELKGWAQRLEQERVRAQHEAELTRQETVIRQANPSYTEDDMGAIMRLAFSHQGDLLAAEQTYKQLQQRWASGYLNQKESVPSNLNQPSPTANAQQPHKFESLNDPNLDLAVQNYLNNIGSFGQ